MRFVQLVLYPPSGGVHPVGAQLGQAKTVNRRALVYVDSFGDGTGVLLYRLTGDPRSVETELRDHPTVLTYELSQSSRAGTDDWYWYVHVEGDEPAVSLVRLVHRHALIVETPIEYPTDESVQVTVAGTQRGIHRAFKELSDVVDFEVHSTGEYDPMDDGLLVQLTRKQREVLQTAIDLGYYEVPRKSTHVDIAAKMECATSTVDEHLRKAESTVFESIVR